jgi:WD40 repeat protein
MFKDLFISYGRRESLAFVGYLHQQFKLRGIEGWFDKVNIPDGDDYSLRISNGIESAHNFVYVMAPRCMTSPYCLVELEYARVLGKRIIPVAQIPIFDWPAKELSPGDKKVMSGFYEIYGIKGIEINTEKDVLDRSHSLLGKTDWVYGRQELSPDDVKALFEWQAAYENTWHEHESVDYLQKFTMPKFGKDIDPIDGVIDSILKVVAKQENYVQKHTELLQKSLNWNRNNRIGTYLLAGEERKEAEEWMQTDFVAPEQPPCIISDLHADYLCQSKKNADNLYTDVFISYSTEDIDKKELVRKHLSRHLITTWSNTHDIMPGLDYGEAINRGLEQSDFIVFLISPDALASRYCIEELEYANQLNKKVIPILVEPTDFSQYDLPLIKQLAVIQYINMTDNKSETDFARDMSDLIYQLNQEKDYFHKHKLYLARALKWQRSKQTASILPRGNSLDKAKVWLKAGQKRGDFAPTPLHEEFVRAAESFSSVTGTDVFISFAPSDSDFSRRLNEQLQINGKSTWFEEDDGDANASEFQAEAYKGIENSNDFLFVVSPKAVVNHACLEELEHAVKFGKRILPLFAVATDKKTMPPALADLRGVTFFGLDFQKQFMDVLRLIDIDKEHVAEHTLWQNRANEWSNNNRSSDYLLNASALSKAETWLKSCYDNNVPNYREGEEVPKSKKIPNPTFLHLLFLQSSRAAIAAAEAMQAKIAATLATRLRYAQIALAIAGILLVLAIAGFAVAFVQSNIAKENAEIAQKNEIEAKKNAQIASDNANQAKRNAETALRNAREAEEQRLKAEEALEEVKRKEKSLQEALHLAKMARDTAQIRQKEAEIAKNNAEKQKILAEQATLEAKFAKKKTDIANKEALQKLYFFNSKEFAFKSLGYEALDEETKKTKALLALTSYLLIDGTCDHPDDREYPIETLDALQKALIKYDKGLKDTKNNRLTGEFKSITSNSQTIALAIDMNKISVGKLIEDAANYPKFELSKTFDIKGFAREMKFTPDETTLIVGASTGNVLQYKNDNLTDLSASRRVKHSSDVLKIHFQDKKTMITGSINQLIYWRLDNETTFHLKLPTHAGNVRGISSNKDAIFVITETGRVYRFKLAGINEETVAELIIENNRYSFYSVVMTSDKDILIGTGQGEVLHYVLTDTAHFDIMPSKHSGAIHNLILSSDQKWLASGGLDAVVSVWNLTPFYEGKMPIERLPNYSFENEFYIYALDFDPKNQYLIFGDSKRVQLSCVDIQILNKKLKNQLKNLPNNQLSENFWNYFKKGDVIQPKIDYK